jgi:hypothetical protein
MPKAISRKQDTWQCKRFQTGEKRTWKCNVMYKQEIRKTIPWAGVTIQQFLAIHYYWIRTVHDLNRSDVQGVDAARLYHDGSVYFLDMGIGWGNHKESNTSLIKLENDKNAAHVSSGGTNRNVQPYRTMLTCAHAKENLSSSHHESKILQRWEHVTVIGVQFYRKGDVSF